MPPLTRWYIKTALAYLASALLLGVLLALPPSVPLPRLLRATQPAYFHLFLVGWATQMIFGVLYWLLPIVTRDRPRGSAPLGWATYGLLNAGLLLRVLAEPLQTLAPAAVWGWLLVLAALLQWTAALLFVALVWSRIKDRYRGG